MAVTVPPRSALDAALDRHDKPALSISRCRPHMNRKPALLLGIDGLLPRGVDDLLPRGVDELLPGANALLHALLPGVNDILPRGVDGLPPRNTDGLLPIVDRLLLGVNGLILASMGYPPGSMGYSLVIPATIRRRSAPRASSPGAPPSPPSPPPTQSTATTPPQCFCACAPTAHCLCSEVPHHGLPSSCHRRQRRSHAAAATPQDSGPSKQHRGGKRTIPASRPDPMVRERCGAGAGRSP